MIPHQAVLALVLALALAGCGTSRDPAADSPVDSPSPAVPEVATPERPAALPRPSSRLPVPPPDIDLGQILQASGDQVTSLLGRPELRRRERQAELWQYRSTSCVLNLFVYPNGSNKAPEVTHAEARSRTGSLIPPRMCLASLIARRNSGRS
jgi:hypothetical protein